jgi:8-oxo-dGTP pyrophosphatase MutT (NUDIX family)
MNPEILERNIAYSGYLTVERLRVRVADGTQVWREVERHGDAAVVLPYDRVRRSALVVRLFRAPVFEASGAAVLEEACAGMIVNEQAESAARREALEELGVTLHALERGGGVPSEHEDITVAERPLVALAADVDLGQIADAKLVMLVLALRVRRPELFA